MLEIYAQNRFMKGLASMAVALAGANLINGHRPAYYEKKKEALVALAAANLNNGHSVTHSSLAFNPKSL